MDHLQKQEFTRRISNSNRGEMIVVIYDIFFAYEEEARKCHEAGEYEAFKQAVRKAQEAVTQLRDALDFHYPIAGELYPLYQFSLEQLSKCLYQNKPEGLNGAKKVLNPLYAAFVEAAKQDNSEPLMKHTQQIVAGMTYQKGALTETLQDSDNSRGFFV